MATTRHHLDPRAWALPALLVGLWALSSHLGWVNPDLLPSPLLVLDTAYAHWQSGELTTGLQASLIRDLSGFVTGSLVGFGLGALLGVSRLAEHLVTPTFNTFKQIAFFAWIPLLSMWFGQGELAKIILIAMAAFIPVTLNTFEGIRSVSRELGEVSQVLALNRRQIWLKLILPSAAPQIFTGLTLALIYSWLATIGAEYFLSAGAGVTNPMLDGREQFYMALVIYGMLVIALLGALFNALAVHLERRAQRWRSHL